MAKSNDQLRDEWEASREDKAELGDWAAANVGELFERLGKFEFLAYKADLREKYPDHMAACAPRGDDEI